jgi:4-hydroxythreonine-4-phosphate dehydrogenase
VKPRVAITLGDPSGIGPEIVAQAVRHPRVLRACEPLLVGEPLAFALHHQTLPTVEILSIPGIHKKLALGKPSPEGGRSAIESLHLALGLLKTRQAHALVTAPVSKESFHLADLGFPGHTEWLAQQTKASEVAMLMISGPMRALLMTRHVPLSRVSRTLKAKDVQMAGRLGFEFLRRYVGAKRPRIVLCGINPHAGDGGVIGKEEGRIYPPALRHLHRQGIAVQGPVAADAAFHDMSKGKYDLALAAYHDQGMIALKVFGAERLVNLTLGLPYIRTSPGHGTAYDIAGQRKADPRPMVEAILLAARYAARD